MVHMKNSSLPIFLSPIFLGGALAIFVGFAVQPSLNPIHASSNDIAQGNALFHEKGCEYCHGANGIGIQGKGPSLFTVGKHLKKDAIEKQIHDGGASMPAFGDSLQPDEIKALVDMLAKKKKAPKGSRVPANPVQP